MVKVMLALGNHVLAARAADPPESFSEQARMNEVFAVFASVATKVCAATQALPNHPLTHLLPRMVSELERLSTFARVPNLVVSARQLARIGFYRDERGPDHGGGGPAPLKRIVAPEDGWDTKSAWECKGAMSSEAPWGLALSVRAMNLQR